MAAARLAAQSVNRTPRSPMQGRINRKKLQALAIPQRPEEDPVCPLCDRPIPKAQQDAHHLLPKSRGGVSTVLMHRLCHRQIHALLAEAELERSYQSLEALRLHPEIARFIDWVRHKPDSFYQRTRKSQRLRSG